jgi:hypothetical protein
MEKVENTFKSLIFRPCTSLSCAFLLATVLRGLLIMQSQKLPSDSSELLPHLCPAHVFPTTHSIVAFSFRFPHPLFIHYLFNYDKSSSKSISSHTRTSRALSSENQNQGFLTKSNTHPTLVMNYVSITNEQVVLFPHANILFHQIFQFHFHL